MMVCLECRMQPDPTYGADADAVSTTARLAAVIREQIDAAGGCLRFSRFMELALYAPGLGYYSAGARKIGRDPRDGSDFVTAPELTPLFARALARPVAAALGVDGDILELGGGTGRLAADLLLELEVLGKLPQHYRILEVSADLRERQHATLQRSAAHLADRVEWLDALPERIDGVVLGNEVLDALPVELVVFDGSTWRLRGVTSIDDDFVFCDAALPLDLLATLREAGLPDAPNVAGYVTELHPITRAWIASLVDRMTDAAVMLLIDYGFPRSEYYHPQRATGTLMAHRSHRARSDVLANPGLQDITSHVDFSVVAEAATEAGAHVIGYTSQASFLIDAGIADLIAGMADDARTWAPQAAALQTLLAESEMGELFKVIGIARRWRTLPGFMRSDRRSALERIVQ